MKPKHLTILFALLAAALLPRAAHAQSSTCYEFACDSYAVYDPVGNEISGYSRTVDYWWEGWYLFAESLLGDPNGETAADVYAGGYSEAEADVSYAPGPSGGYEVHGVHSYGLEDNIAYDGDSYYDVWVAPPPVITGVTTSGSPWYGGGPYTFAISGSGFGGQSVAFSSTGPFESSSVSVVSDSLIQGSVTVWPNAGDMSVIIWIGGIGAIEAALFQVAPPLPPPPPPAPPLLMVTSNGYLVQTGSPVYITPAPSLPLVASLVPSSGGSLTGAAAWTFSTNYTGPGQFSYFLPPDGPTQAANAAWDIGAYLGGNFAGGSAVVTVTYQGITQSLSFTILGQNPDVNTVKSAIGTSPWYIQQLANYESHGYHQFDASGYPNWGSPDGYGIMMVDFNNNVYDLWTWTTNVNDGLANNTANSSTATSKWNIQLRKWRNYNAQNPSSQVAMYGNVSWGSDPCVFSNSPSGGQHPFSDGIWIKMYNTGPSYQPYFITFANGGWSVNDEATNYVYQVCSYSP